MAFTIEFDDIKLTERIRNPYKGINEVYSLGMSFADFFSIKEELKKSEHIFIRLVEDDMADRVAQDSYFYAKTREFLELCINDTSLYTLDNFLFFLHMQGLSIPEHYLQFYIDTETPVENLVTTKNLSPLEAAIRGFAKSDKSKNAITNVYTCNSIEDVCVASLYHILKQNLVIKKCNNCNKYFVPLLRSDAIYCDRLSPHNPHKTCKEDGSQRTFENKLKMDDAEKLRRKIYQAKQMRVIRNPDIAFYKENFETWKTDVTRWKTEIKNGQRTSEEFIQWLNESNKRQ